MQRKHAHTLQGTNAAHPAVPPVSLFFFGVEAPLCMAGAAEAAGLRVWAGEVRPMDEVIDILIMAGIGRDWQVMQMIKPFA